MNEFVFPINDGCGVLVGDLLVTAAHVVNECDSRLFIGGKKICLRKEEALLLKYKQVEDGADVAVFRLSGYKSPIEFDDSLPEKDMLLECLSLEYNVEGGLRMGRVTLNKSEKPYRLLQCQATIEEIAGNFFQCKTSVVLKPGSSGSPVFRNGKLFGILHGGREGTDLCVFQSSSSILSLIRKVVEM